MEDVISEVKADIYRIKDLAKLNKLKCIKLLIAGSWKYPLFKSIKKELKESHIAGKIIKKVIVKGHEKDIPKIVQGVVRDPSRMPNIILDQKQEMAIFEEARVKLEKEFGCSMKIVSAERSKEIKASQAIPGKPAILVE